MAEHENNKLKPIDLKKLFNEKNPRLAALLPRFIYKYINRIVHVDECNEIIEKYGHLEGIEFVQKSIEYFGVHEEVSGLENIPDQGRFIFVANHPLGGFDSLLFMSNVYQKLGELRFLVNDVLMQIKPLAPLFVPINKHGAHSRMVARQIEETYRSDKQVLIFPSGLASRKIKGQVTDTEWKKHFIQKAVEHQRDVIPVHISGQNSNFFYRLSNFRKAIGIKWNIEMFYLADETFNQKGRTFKLTFGKPIPHATFDNSKNPKEWADEVRRILYQLPT
ncbi:1-acyl-sn-glycerol-3-phosphate acyltransferase [Mangrovibacterium marinum]|uniref:Acyltransferase-like protein n=1 Tax=Mangrovibacterium marinum TaxID=1639118 RepID=A0A2T5C038_9BACT|nr:1-acyl-sn-glycerol-3-phosphate acyltransferase [Mangrovibacterium marinum]PTN07925.1 acyltransferase-like protein [Mangrovibacterium marinum]